MTCANFFADASSSGRSFLVLKLVSTPSTIDSGSADSLSKTAIFCSLPSSFRRKFSFCRLDTGAPRASVTVTNTFTSFTSTLRVPGSWAISEALAAAMKAVAIKKAESREPRATRHDLIHRDRSSQPATRSTTGIRFIQELPIMMRPDPGCASRPLNFFGKRLPVCPDCSVFKVFFLPDRHRFLKRVDNPATGLKCRAAVGRCHHDQNTRLANLQPAQPMDDGCCPNRKALPRLRGQ